MTTAIARTGNTQGLAAVEPIDGRNQLARLNMRELKQIAEVFIESGSFTDVKQTAQAMVKIMAGAELGFSPIVSMTGVHFFNGKVSLGANLIASLIKDSGKYEYKITEHTDKACSIQFYQVVGGELKSLGVAVRYTIEDAQKAQLTGKDNWKKYPKDMLFAACIRQGSRRYCADVLRGMTPAADTELENDIDRTAMDAAEMPADTEHQTTIDGEIVDTETGEIIDATDEADDLQARKPPATQPAQSASTKDTEQAPLITEADGPDGFDEVLEAVEQLLTIKIGPATARAKYLNGRDPSQMPIRALTQMRDDLALM